MAKKVIFTWSGGKDSAMALYEFKISRDYKVLTLLTTVTEDYNRISMHGVRCTLLEQQAELLDIPIEKILITKDSSNEQYESRMSEKLLSYKSQGVLSVVFGDIFLEDLRKYREKNLSKISMTGLFPLWKKDTVELAKKFLQLGFKAIITCVDSTVLDKKFVGRQFDEQFLSELPPGVDYCGENGEFHSFVYDGPMFKKSIVYERGKVILRDNRFYYCDLIPAQ